MITDVPNLIKEIRARFAHVETCPFEGPRVFFENAGGALTLNSVVETSAKYASYPDNQGRANGASKALMAAIAKGRSDARVFLNAPDGEVFVGESGTEVLFRLVRTAALGAPDGGTMLGSSLEHPASRSAMAHWAKNTNRAHIIVPHDNASGTVDVEAYLRGLTPDVRVATVVQTSPVTGISVDVPEVVNAIRSVSPDCYVIVDGIQHASHGSVDVPAYHADGYAISPYKVFSRHGYGIGWASDRLTGLTKEAVLGGPDNNWELGTRDSGSYATFSDVVDYFDWLGGYFTDSADPRQKIEASAKEIHAHEQNLIDKMMHGVGNLPGLADMPDVMVIGGPDNDAREGVVSLTLENVESADLVEQLNDHGVRTHIRLNDHYCGNILGPLGLEDCVRVSISHYNTVEEVTQFLAAMCKIRQQAS